MLHLRKFLDNIDLYDRLPFFLILSFPIALVIGNTFINIFFFLFTVSFVINFSKNQNLINSPIIFLLLLFLLSLIINLIFSINFYNSFPRVIKIILIIFFVLEISRLALKYKSFLYDNIFKTWFFLYLILSFDIIFEFTFGYNILKFSSYMPGRVSSFFGSELVVGAYLHGFTLFFLSYIKNNYYKNNNIFFFIIICFVILLSFLVGERTNFLKLFLAVFIFTLVTDKKNLTKLILFYCTIIVLIISFLNFNDTYKNRYYHQFQFLLSKDTIGNFYKKTQYGAHQIAAFKIFKEYPFFGVGIKNFREESYKEKYEDKNNKVSKLRYATHPHQVHLEFLSETGLFGYLIFILFIFTSCWLGIKKFLKNNNIYLISSIVFIFSSLLPIIPSGSFLSTFNSAIFWINFSIMSSFIMKKTKF